MHIYSLTQCSVCPLAVVCGQLSNIANGVVNTMSGTTFTKVATYSCNHGYVLSGTTHRTCGADRSWTPEEPVCNRMFYCSETFRQCMYSITLATQLVKVMFSYYVSLVITAEVVSSGDPPAVGQNYSLVCTVIGADVFNPTINYQWFKTTPSRTQVGTNSPTLTFDPLLLSDAGQYNCEATVSSSLLQQDITITSRFYEIRFASKHIYVCNRI